ncbi:integral membrane sensor signal transduction histidine kinase [Candidatus Nitrosopumilus sediminis]|uniref:histidine kinase n=1 Tax=Candidatus Nitrosopumilus sediminis TaxID=1229909 RepID=K0B9A0_9ARCH|nr:integral membrane sensor signal transduction histidine kinase [Candidatus Nitrosopumilus sediminis]
MLSIKITLFLVSGVSSFIIFYMGIVNFLTSVEETTGLIMLIFSIFVATGTLLATVNISRNITQPIEKLTQDMKQFSATNKASKRTPLKTNVSEIFQLNEDFKIMEQRVEKTIELTNDYVEKLKEMDRKKIEFSSMVSHELKTPLVPILGYVQMLQKKNFLGELNEKQSDAVNEIHAATIRLQRLVGDILTTQKLDLGKLDFNKEETNVLELLNSVIKEFQPIAEEKKVILEMNFNEDICIFTDKDRISQVFSNLIKNSIDFVPKSRGIITIGAKDCGDFVEFLVRDNGSGMSIENQKDIFKKFYQIDTSTSRKRSGSGLGLAICKGIVEGLGGKIWVESKVNEQTTFYFTIPKKPIDSSAKNELNNKISN